MGLQLSFASMVGLLVLSPRIYTLFPRGRAASGACPQLLAASLGATICTAPLTAFYFNRIPLVGPIANILVGSVATFTFLSGAAALMLGLLVPVLGSFAGLLPRAGCGSSWRWPGLFARIPYHAIYFTNPYLKYWLIFLAAIFGYCALTPEGQAQILLARALPRERWRCCCMCRCTAAPGVSTRWRWMWARGPARSWLPEGTALVDCGSSENFINAGDEAGDTLNTYGYFDWIT